MRANAPKNVRQRAVTKLMVRRMWSPNCYTPAKRLPDTTLREPLPPTLTFPCSQHVRVRYARDGWRSIKQSLLWRVVRTCVVGRQKDPQTIPTCRRALERAEVLVVPSRRRAESNNLVTRSHRIINRAVTGRSEW